jgi:hypothetical protein
MARIVAKLRNCDERRWIRDRRAPVTTVMILTWAMILGGPLLWWTLRATARLGSAAAWRAAQLGTRLGLVLFLVAGGILLVSPGSGGANTAGTAVWMIAGLVTVWSTSRWRWSLPSIVDRWSVKREHQLRAEAEAGNPLAAHVLGLGLKVRGELPEARRFLLMAAEAGLPGAQWDLGRLIDEVEGAAAARPWFQAAADRGHPGAQHLLRLLKP